MGIAMNVLFQKPTVSHPLMICMYWTPDDWNEYCPKTNDHPFMVSWNLEDNNELQHL